MVQAALVPLLFQECLTTNLVLSQVDVQFATVNYPVPSLIASRATNSGDVFAQFQANYTHQNTELNLVADLDSTVSISVLFSTHSNVRYIIIEYFVLY